MGIFKALREARRAAIRGVEASLAKVKNNVIIDGSPLHRSLYLDDHYIEKISQLPERERKQVRDALNEIGEMSDELAQKAGHPPAGIVVSSDMSQFGTIHANLGVNVTRVAGGNGVISVDAGSIRELSALATTPPPHNSELFNIEETRALLGHEYSHLVHQDTYRNPLKSSSTGLAIGLTAGVAAVNSDDQSPVSSLMRGAEDIAGTAGEFITGAAIIYGGSVIGTRLGYHYAVGHNHAFEFRADEFSGDLTDDRPAMKSALEKFQHSQVATVEAMREAMLQTVRDGILDGGPLKYVPKSLKLKLVETGLEKIASGEFVTHPATAERIARVEEQIAAANAAAPGGKLPGVKGTGLVILAGAGISAAITLASGGDAKAALQAAADATPIDVLKADSLPNAITRAVEWVDPSFGGIAHALRKDLRRAGFEVERDALDEEDREQALLSTVADVLRIQFETGKIDPKTHPNDKKLQTLYDIHTKMLAEEDRMDTVGKGDALFLQGRHAEWEDFLHVTTKDWLKEQGKYEQTLNAMENGMAKLAAAPERAAPPPTEARLGELNTPPGAKPQPANTPQV